MVFVALKSAIRGLKYNIDTVGDKSIKIEFEVVSKQNQSQTDCKKNHSSVTCIKHHPPFIYFIVDKHCSGFQVQAYVSV